MTKANESWSVAPIQNYPREVVIRRNGLLQRTREYCRLNRELIGFMYGYPYQKSVLLVGMNTYGVGSETSSELEPFFLEQHNEFMQRAKEVYPSLTTILYHSHPRINPAHFPKQTIQQLREDLQDGIFDYLRDYGVTPTLYNALAEFSRTLSEEDLENIIGKITILLTDTRYPKDEFSHLNVYEIAGKDHLSVKTLRVAALEDKPKQWFLVFNEIAEYLHALQTELKKKYEHSIQP